MKPYDANIFFTRTLLGLDEPSRTVQANDQAASNLRIQSATVSGFLNPVNCQYLHSLILRAPFHVPEHAFNPRDHLMTRRIARFVEVDHTRADERFEVALERSTSDRDWCEMSGSDE